MRIIRIICLIFFIYFANYIYQICLYKPTPTTTQKFKSLIWELAKRSFLCVFLVSCFFSQINLFKNKMCICVCIEEKKIHFYSILVSILYYPKGSFSKYTSKLSQCLLLCCIFVSMRIKRKKIRLFFISKLIPISR